ncbi:anillin-like [Daphnia pulex]|uniref:anillin-like n=1 Tax=Daphnia pulex TaxID=6669 RepID=UPI001EDFC6C7|nr:anillin-like [Daphnia pulex]
MDLFTQNMIKRTKQRQEMMKVKPNSGLGSLSSSKLENQTIPSNSSQISDIDENIPLCNFEEKRNVIRKENDAGIKHLRHSPTKIEVPSDQTSPLQVSRKTRLEALAYRINDWVDESVVAPKPISSTPEKNPRGTSTPSKIRDTTTLKSAASVKSVLQECTPVKVSGNEDVSTPYKSLALDKSVLQSLESQGFTPTESRSRLIYEFEKEQENEIEEETAKSWTFTAGSPHKSASPLKTRSPAGVTHSSNTPAKPKGPASQLAGKFSKRPSGGLISSDMKSARISQNIRENHESTPSSSSAVELEKKKPENRMRSVQELAAQFDSPRVPMKDPAEMTISERKALFEHNKGQISNSKLRTPQTSRSVISPRTTAIDSKNKGNLDFYMKEKSNSPLSVVSELSSVQTAKSNHFKEQQNPRGGNITKMSEPLTHGAATSSPISNCTPKPNIMNTVASSSKEYNLDQPSSGMFRNIHAEPSLDKNIEEQQKPSGALYAGIHQVRPIRVSPPKPGKLYPCLSDIDSVTENESESDEQQTDNTPKSTDGGDLRAGYDLDSSFTIEILGRAGLSQFINTPKRKLTEMQLDKPQVRPNLGVKEIISDDDDSTDISDLLDEALGDTEHSVSPKHQKRDDCDQLTLEDDGLAISLFHSVSSYRQQKEKTFTPMKQIVRNPEVRQVASRHETYESNESLEVSVQQQIRTLQEEISTQQSVMAQASQALNLCRATAEFSGSTEQVEGEKLLLISSQKKQAAINEIQRLKSEAAMKVISNKLASRGTLSFSNIGLPLKKDFLSMLKKGGGDVVHYFIVLIRSRGQVIPLQMLSTVDGIQDGVLRFPNLVQLRNLPAEFDVVIEVYALQTWKEKMNHETKYHIRKDNSKMRLTPKKLSKQDSRGMPRTPLSVSGGSSTANLRSSSFGLVGVTNITPTSLRRREWSLEKVPVASPIDGTLQLKIQSHTESLIEERGFLTVFEDVGGFGAWHRRWCLLSNDQLLFWKYPDDEKLKEPQYSINLRKCITEHVDIVSNDVCARPNTFLLITVRPVENTDKDSLVMTCYPNQTALRHLISADLKEERQLWCMQINRVLANFRVWNLE